MVSAPVDVESLVGERSSLRELDIVYYGDLLDSPPAGYSVAVNEVFPKFTLKCS